MSYNISQLRHDLSILNKQLPSSHPGFTCQARNGVIAIDLTTGPNVFTTTKGCEYAYYKTCEKAFDALRVELAGVKEQNEKLSADASAKALNNPV